VISSVTGNYLAAPSGRSTSAFQVPSTSSLWFDVEYVGASSSTAPVFTVIGGTLVLDAKCQITDNKIAGASYGGAINASAGSVEMRGGEIASCKASRGGAIHLSGTATFAMTGGILTNNEAVSAGAVWLEGNAKMMMSGTALIQNNTATGYTGGIVLNANAELEIVGSTPKIKTNNGGSASNGGTGVLLYNETTTLTCTGSTWKDVILDDNIPTEMPSLTRRLLVTNQDQLISALSDTSIPVCVDISGYTIDIDRTFNIHGIVLLKGNNPTDTLIRDPSFTGTLLSVESDGILILPLYVVIDGNSITASAPLIDVKLGGTLNMRNGSTHLINANTSGNGGAVSVAGTFLFKDGLIGGSGTPNNAQKGGGVYIASGGVMTMTGGAVTYNSSVMEGAGVYVDNGGTFNYSDGIIHSNQSTMTSDGIYLDGILNIGTPGLVFSGIDLNDGFGLYVTLNGVVRIDLGSGLQVMPAGSASSTSLFLDIFGPDNTSGPYHFDGL